MKACERLLHDMAAELEEALALANYPDRCELCPTTARRLLRRYETWRKKQRAASGGGGAERLGDAPSTAEKHQNVGFCDKLEDDK